MKILVIDDNSVVRRGVVRELHDHEVREASDGAEALEVLETSFIPDIIMTDIMMPGIHGAALLAKLRRKVACPILAMSGGAIPPGYDAEITKPVNIDRLRETIHAALWRGLNGRSSR